jgi:Zn-finger nucleic acid-binding protein
MRCPRCRLVQVSTPSFRASAVAREEGVPLEPRQHACREPYLTCPSCAGTFVERSALIAIERWARDRGRRATVAELARRALQAARPTARCPRCDVDMFTRQWGVASLVSVDVCIDCNGVWLDGGELEQLEAVTV